MFDLTWYHAFATISFVTLAAGLCFRRQRIRHAVLMNSAIAMDLCIVLLLEFQRDVIHVALTLPHNLFQQGHIIAMVLVVLLYVPMLILGWRLLLGRAGKRARWWHIRLGLTTFTLRTIGFILMFSM